MPDTATERVIHRSVWDPTKSPFKQKVSERATCMTIRCSLETCPIREAGGCTYVPVLGWAKCPYGTVRTETGPTKRAKGFWKWCQDRKDEFPDAGRLGYPVNKLAFVGNYVYLPYAHMDMNEAVPFLAHGGFMRHGNQFVPREHWTISTVVSLLKFKPVAMMGGEIVSYQKEQVPKFLAHLREVDPVMWAELLKERPDLDQPPDYVGRKALIHTLAHPIEWSTEHAEYPVQWRWDGERVTTTSEHVYSKTWGDVPLGSFELAGVPAGSAAIVVRDNSWVNENTAFVD